MRNDRGFSLLLVLLVAVLLAVVGTSAVLLGTSEVGTAGARSTRAQALAAAEAGLAHFRRVAQPSMTEARYYMGKAGNDADSFYWLPDVPGRNGETFQSRYRVRGVGPGPLPGTGLAIVEGEVLSGGQVVGRTELSVIVGKSGIAEDAGTGQEDFSETGDSSDDQRRNGRPTVLM